MEKLEGIAQNRFLEIGVGESPYLSRLSSAHFEEGIFFAPFVSLQSPLFQSHEIIGDYLDQKLSRFFRFSEMPGTRTYRECALADLDLRPECVDFCYSRSVLEHVRDIEDMAEQLHCIMHPHGIMLHAVDFTAHSDREDGNILPFYAYSREQWLHKKPQLINLLRINELIETFTNVGFETSIMVR